MADSSLADFSFELVSPSGIVFSGPVEAVIAPTADGEITVLAGHTPLVSLLKTGILTIVEKGDQRTNLLIFGGFLDVIPSRLSVLVEQSFKDGEWTAETIDDAIDQMTAQQDKSDNADEKALIEENLYTLQQLRKQVA